MPIDFNKANESGIAEASAIDQHIISSTSEADIGVVWITGIAQCIAARIAVEICSVEILISRASRDTHLRCQVEIRLCSRTGPLHHQQNSVDLPTEATGSIIGSRDLKLRSVIARYDVIEPLILEGTQSIGRTK